MDKNEILNKFKIKNLRKNESKNKDVDLILCLTKSSLLFIVNINFENYNIISKDNIKHEILYDNLLDIYFVTTINKENVKRYLFKFILKNTRDFFLVELEFEEFINFRDYFFVILKPKGNFFTLDLKKFNEKKIDLLIKNNELQIIYDEIVLKSKLIDSIQFFNILFPELNKDYLNKEYKQIEFKNNPYIIEKFIPNLNNISQKNLQNINNKEMIYLKKEDKEYLLNKFPEIKNQLKENIKNNYEKKKDIEIDFWNNFFLNQKKENSFIYGNSFDDKILRTNLPSFLKEKYKFIKKKNNIKKNIEDSLNICEYIRYNTSHNYTKNNDLINLINNLSISNWKINVNNEEKESENENEEHPISLVKRRSINSFSLKKDNQSFSKDDISINLKNNCLENKKDLMKTFNKEKSFKNIFDSIDIERINKSKILIKKITENNYKNFFEYSLNINEENMMEDLKSNHIKYKYFTRLYFNTKNQIKKEIFNKKLNFGKNLNSKIDKLKSNIDKKNIIMRNYNEIWRKVNVIYKRNERNMMRNP